MLWVCWLNLYLGHTLLLDSCTHCTHSCALIPTRHPRACAHLTHTACTTRVTRAHIHIHSHGTRVHIHDTHVHIHAVKGDASIVRLTDTLHSTS